MLQHRVESSEIGSDCIKLFNSYDTRNTHVLGNLHGVGAPWGNHSGTRTNKSFVDANASNELHIAKKPIKLCYI